MPQKGLKISKWGNGQGIRLPLAVMQLLSLKLGDDLNMEVSDNKIILTPKKKRLSLAERFAGYTGESVKEDVWSDTPVGKEVW
jgi:antitoxin MazE